jgi:hypothetical protein
MAEQKDAESVEQQLNVTVGDKQMPFTVVEENELDSIVEFKENNQDIFQIEGPETEQ